MFVSSSKTWSAILGEKAYLEPETQVHVTFQIGKLPVQLDLTNTYRVDYPSRHAVGKASCRALRTERVVAAATRNVTVETPAIDSLHRQHNKLLSRLMMLMGVGLVVISIPLMVIGIGFLFFPLGILCIWLARRMKRDSAKNLAILKQATREAGTMMQP